MVFIFGSDPDESRWSRYTRICSRSRLAVMAEGLVMFPYCIRLISPKCRLNIFEAWFAVIVGKVIPNNHSP